MVFLGFGKFARADKIYALEPLTGDERGSGHRTRVWIEVGQPEDKPLVKACGKADEVLLYCFSHAAEIWWRGIEGKLARLRNLAVWRVPTASSQALAALAQRSMQLQATVQEGTLTLGDGKNSIDIEPLRWK